MRNIRGCWDVRLSSFCDHFCSQSKQSLSNGENMHIYLWSGWTESWDSAGQLLEYATKRWAKSCALRLKILVWGSLARRPYIKKTYISLIQIKYGPWNSPTTLGLWFSVMLASEAGQAKERGGIKGQPCGPGMHFLNKDLLWDQPRPWQLEKELSKHLEFLTELYRPLESRVGYFTNSLSQWSGWGKLRNLP